MGEVKEEIIAKKAVLWSLIRKEERMWQQKSRAMWLKEGDQNTKFFHLTATARKRAKRIENLMIRGINCDDPDAVKDGVAQHFESHYNQCTTIHVKEFDCAFNKLKPCSIGA
ncbi:hypothetical protein PTKIN_Ptkin14bG0183700 [Pterospermum kingtungense]